MAATNLLTTRMKEKKTTTTMMMMMMVATTTTTTTTAPTMMVDEERAQDDKRDSCATAKGKQELQIRENLRASSSLVQLTNTQAHWMLQQVNCFIPVALPQSLALEIIIPPPPLLWLVRVARDGKFLCPFEVGLLSLVELKRIHPSGASFNQKDHKAPEWPIRVQQQMFTDCAGLEIHKNSLTTHKHPAS